MDRLEARIYRDGCETQHELLMLFFSIHERVGNLGQMVIRVWWC